MEAARDNGSPALANRQRAPGTQLDELERLSVLSAHGRLDGPPDPALDAVTRLAARVFEVTTALVCVIEADRQWFKSSSGRLNLARQLEGDEVFGAPAIMRADRLLVVPDARRDPRLACSELVIGPPGIRFYATVPVRSAEGYVLGALLIMDLRPRQITAAETAMLADIAQCAAAVLAMYRTATAIGESEAHYRHATELNPQIPWTTDATGRVLSLSTRGVEIMGRPDLDMKGGIWSEAVHPGDLEEVEARWSRSRQTASIFDHEFRLRLSDGSYRWFRTYAAPRLAADGSVLRWYGLTADVHDRHLSRARVEFLTQHDGLTGVANRWAFRDMLEREIAVISRKPPGSRGFALFSIGLTNFRAVNDTLGYAAGDATLQAVAVRLGACLRETDIVARAGSDEFLVLQSDVATPDDAAPLAERILNVLATPDVLGPPVEARIGVVLCPRDGTIPDRLLQNADLARDRALILARTRGGAAWHMFSPGMDEAVRARRELRADLAAAVDRGQMSLVYQPLFGLRSNRVEGFEALLRWDSPNRGTVSPATFIPIAEEAGLMGQIGAWVLAQACREAATWPYAVRLSVNLSSVQFALPDLIDTVTEALQLSGLPSTRLELEITESVALLNDEANLAVLQRLRGLGVTMSLDDFGTGYSSLSYLHCFAFDKLKIDRSFVIRAGEGPQGRAILQAIVAMSRALGIAVAAEGVETHAQLDQMRASGCDQVQGFLISPPIPAAAIPALIERLDVVSA